MAEVTRLTLKVRKVMVHPLPAWPLPPSSESGREMLLCFCFCRQGSRSQETCRRSPTAGETPERSWSSFCGRSRRPSLLQDWGHTGSIGPRLASVRPAAGSGTEVWPYPSVQTGLLITHPRHCQLPGCPSWLRGGDSPSGGPAAISWGWERWRLMLAHL